MELYRPSSISLAVKFSDGRGEEQPKAGTATFEIKGFEVQGSGVLHAVWITLPIVFNTNHQVTVSLAGSQANLALGITNGVIDGVVQYTGQQVLVEEAVYVLGFHRNINAESLE